jgi:hypothetical protein
MTPRANRHPIPSAWIALVGVALALLGISLAGCSKRVTDLDASFQVEGTPSSSELVAFPDTPTIGMLFRDTLESGPSQGDYLIDTPAFYTIGPGTNRGMIFDYTQAGDFQIFRQESNGGYLNIKDFPVRETKQWVDSHSELYQFVDPAPVSASSDRYLGRGIINGVVNQTSPLTNVATTTTSPIDTINIVSSPFPDDSLFTISWTPVVGAVGYWVQVYQFRSDLRTLQERILSGAPAPIFGDKATDLFVGFMPAGVTSYKLGDPPPPGGKVLYRRLTLFNFFYNVRVSAVGPAGELLAYTGSNGDFLLQQFVDLTYLLYPLGAFVVSPTRPELPAPGLRASPSASAARTTSSVQAPRDWTARHPHSRWFTPEQLTAAPGH